jgi:DNA-directed RNA polymerase specialized sigma24 family protein
MGKKLVMSVRLPKPLREIRDEIIFQAVRELGSQKLAAQNLGICEATVSRRLNRIRKKPAWFMGPTK